SLEPVTGEVWAQIEDAVRAGDVDAVMDLCVALEERTRRPLSKRAQALSRELRLNEIDVVIAIQLALRSTGDAGPHGSPAAAAAALFCLGPPPNRRSPARVPPARLEEAVRSRPREWRDTWAQRAIEREWDVPAWNTLRALIRTGD